MANDNKIFDFGEKLGDSVKDRNFGVRTMPPRQQKGGNDDADSAQTHVRQMNGTSDAMIFRPFPLGEQKTVFDSGRLPEWTDFVMSTYSQFSKTDDESDSLLKRKFAMQIAKDNILILDESHSAAGNSKRGAFFRSLTDVAKHVCFLSATYSKRPENMAHMNKIDRKPRPFCDLNGQNL